LKICAGFRAKATDPMVIRATRRPPLKTRFRLPGLSRWTLTVGSLLLFCILSCPAAASAEWVRHYGREWRDEAKAIAVDSAGSVYVTGTSANYAEENFTSLDYATVKYDTKGKRLWVRRYDGPKHYIDQAAAIAVDRDGNVYVTGTSMGLRSGYDYATIKYDTNGKPQWVRRYDGPAGMNDTATALAVDSSGNVYVTGKSENYTYLDYATVKYDADGNQRWVARFNGPKSSDDEASAIAVDRNGNVYVTGASMGLHSGYDYATVKYDPKGNRKWVRRYNGPGNKDDKPAAIAVDRSGNVHVTGGAVWPDNYGGLNYATIKYDTNGNRKWVRRYNGPWNETDRAVAIAVDSVGNVYVTGEAGTNNLIFFDYVTIKYDPDGNRQWMRRLVGPDGWSDSPSGMTVDSAGNVCVTGRVEGDLGYLKFGTVKYDTNGIRQWVRFYAEISGAAAAVAVDAGGNVYVTGQSYSRDKHQDYATIKYDANGD